jgi:PTH1 family peptidyl-tRNA hydrolase
MKIIVGLGNPGPEYQKTPHNAGFMLVDYLAEQFALPLRFDHKFKANYAKGELVRDGLAQDVFLIQPLTFMNESGVAVRALLDYFYKGILEEDEGNHLIVAHDDLDLPLGSFKLQKGKGPKQHNGLLSIYQHLGHKNFWHLRMGVDGRGADRSLPSRDYLLKPYDQGDLEKMRQMIEEVTAELF